MSNEAKVGLFVITALAILTATLLAIANIQLRGGRVQYKTYFAFVGGVEKGAPVRVGGLKAGVVANLHPAAEDQTKIEVTLDLQPSAPVHENSVAAISTLGMLGENYLEITPGTKDSPRLKPGGVIRSVEAVDFATVTRQVGALAADSQALVVDLHKNLNQISAKADQLISNLNDLSGEKNRKSIEELLNRSNQLIADQTPKVNAITDNLLRTTQKIDVLVTELRDTNTKAGGLITNVNSTVDQTRAPLQKDLEQLTVTLAQAQALLEQLQATLSTNDENVNRIFENFRASSQNLEEFTAEIKERPYTLIRVKPKPDRRVPLAAKK